MGTYVRVVNPIRKPKPIGDGICELELTKGFVGLIDEADAGLVGVCSWCVSFNGRNPIPYVKGRPVSGGRLVRLHRFLMGFPKLQIDHCDRNSLNNRRDNLRLVTQSQNMANCGVRKSARIKLKGVSQSGERFAAHLTIMGRTHHIGIYPTAIEAAIAYDQAAVRYFGEFAATNASLGLLSVEVAQ